MSNDTRSLDLTEGLTSRPRGNLASFGTYNTKRLPEFLACHQTAFISHTSNEVTVAEPSANTASPKSFSPG